MFILFGWGFKTTKQFGRRPDCVCPVCSNQGTDFIKITTWFTLFFIPIIPIGFEYVEICPNCGNGHKMSKRDFMEKLAAPTEVYDAPADPFIPDQEQPAAAPEAE